MPNSAAVRCWAVAAEQGSSTAGFWLKATDELPEIVGYIYGDCPTPMDVTSTSDQLIYQSEGVLNKSRGVRRR